MSNQQYDPSQQHTFPIRLAAYRPSKLQSASPPLSYPLGPGESFILQSASHSRRLPSASTPPEQVRSINVRAPQYSISQS